MRPLPMPGPEDFSRLGELLRELADSQPENQTSLAIWSARAREVEDFLKSIRGLSDAVPHFVWHFLSDADIRVRDLGYRRAQLAELEPILDALEAGRSPVDAA